MDRYTEQDTQPISEAPAFFMTGFGYSVMHATKPGTIGLTVATSPLSLSLSAGLVTDQVLPNSFIGAELPWLDITDGLTGAPGSVLCTEPGADVPLPLDTILATVTLSWLTNTHPRCIYSNKFPAGVPFRRTKHFGISNSTRTRSCALRLGCGGHFPALEEPESMLAGPEEFLQKIIPHDLAPREVQS
ncbi:hypothetical protein C8035_v002400 [Colletotrichum spinosum]|uniref:Epoxide hydrolase n=1 Tax=Colletotrichum spinosum TaxID=1347390 RepID=A0A4V3HQ95_9PEZI|nr:hypothetical protein C8035_v002400 [Colletotrichum spinosum]